MKKTIFTLAMLASLNLFAGSVEIQGNDVSRDSTGKNGDLIMKIQANFEQDWRVKFSSASAILNGATSTFYNLRDKAGGNQDLGAEQIVNLDLDGLVSAADVTGFCSANNSLGSAAYAESYINCGASLLGANFAKFSSMDIKVDALVNTGTLQLVAGKRPADNLDYPFCPVSPSACNEFSQISLGSVALSNAYANVGRSMAAPFDSFTTPIGQQSLDIDVEFIFTGAGYKQQLANVVEVYISATP